MSQTKVTIVIPIYKVEKYLDRCIGSIVTQTYKNIEILLIDDGSPDNCPAMCDEWAQRDERIKVIHKTNAGLGMARNTGIDNATGEYICFFDSDDFVDCTIIEKCIASAKQYDSDVVIFGYANAYENGKIEKSKMKISCPVFKGNQICEKLLPGMYTYDMGFGISVWGKFFRLDSIKQNGIRFKSEKEIISEDAFFALEYYPRISIASIINENLYFYFKRYDSLSRAYMHRRQEKNDEFIRCSLSYIEQTGLSGCIRDHVIARYHMYTVATIRQLWRSSVSTVDKQHELDMILKSEVLNRTITLSVLKLHKIKLAIFLLLVKTKLYSLCKLLIRI